MADFNNKYSYGYLTALIDVVTNDLELLTKALSLNGDSDLSPFHDRAMKAIKHKELLTKDLEYIKEKVQE